MKAIEWLNRITKLWLWVMKSNTPDCHLDELLIIMLQSGVLPELPVSANNFLK